MNLKFVKQFQACLCNQNPQRSLDLGIDCRVYNQVYFYHADYVGSVEFITDLSGFINQFYHYAPFSRRDFELKPTGRRAKLARPSPKEFWDGEVITSHNAQTGSLNVNYSFNGKEYDDESSLYYYIHRYYNSEISIWLSPDPLVGNNPQLTPYSFVSNNPVMRIDPDGLDDGEFEFNKTTGEWDKVSTKGDDIGVDFYHWDGVKKDENGNNIQYQTTYVTDRQGNWNTITDGRKYLQGVQRSDNVNYKTIFNEWKTGTGPEYSYMEGEHPMNIKLDKDSWLGAAHVTFIMSKNLKDKYINKFGIGGLICAGLNMQIQMMGGYTASFYSLGEKTLTLVLDSKSRTSFYYHADITNYSRKPGWPVSTGMGTRETNTYQTYLFLK